MARLVSTFNQREQASTTIDGRPRTPDGGPMSVFVKFDVRFRQHLKHPKGSRLAVFTALALHADAQGWSFPSIETIISETGLSKRTVYYARAALERTEVEGRQAVLRISGGGRTSNRYLILASQDQVHSKAHEAGLCTGAKNNAAQYHFLHRCGAKSAPLTRTIEPEPIAECFAFGGDKHLPRRDAGSEGLKAYRKATGFNPLPAAREALLELEAEIGTVVFLGKLKDFVLWGKNVRNVAFFCDFARGKAVLAKPRPVNGKRNPGVRRRSVWTEEELRAAREADAGKEWADPDEVFQSGQRTADGGRLSSDGGGPESCSGDVLPDAAEYWAWLEASGALGEDGVPTWDQLPGGPVYQAWRAQVAGSG